MDDAGGRPDFIKKMIGEKVDVVQTEEWGAPDGNGQRAADIVLQIKGPGDHEGHRRYRRLRRWCGDADRRRLEGVDPVHRQEVEGEITKGIYAAVDKGQETAAESAPSALAPCLAVRIGLVFASLPSQVPGPKANPPWDRWSVGWKGARRARRVDQPNCR